MKINRFIALAAIAILAVTAMGFTGYQVFAQGNHSQVTSISSQADACAQDQADGTEAASGTDTDNVDLQCGDQNAPDTGVETSKDQETVGAADTDNVEEQVGDQNGVDTGAEAPESASSNK